ncbi:MAG: glycoside hydrolase family 3 N-terminal domain-containing protein [Microbacterium sp.]
MTPEQIRQKLTLDEKIAQLTGVTMTDLLAPPVEGSDAAFSFDLARLATLRPHGAGHISMAWFAGSSRERLRDDMNAVQAAIAENAPFGIGALVHFEAISGVTHRAAPQFPTAWAQAAAWNPDLVEAQAAVSSAYVQDVGGHIVFSPVMDIARDPRWGRIHETYGEDPELVARNAVAFVHGIHGRDSAPSVLATGKHFLGYGASEGGLNQAITAIGQRALVDEYAEPFRRAITEAGLSVVMNSYNDIDGVPAAANRWLLTELLRDQLRFTGIVVSDYDSVRMLETIFHTARTAGEAAAQAVAAGIDAELPSMDRFAGLTDEVRSGRLDERIIDEAVDRVLAIKSRMGLIPGAERRAGLPIPSLEETAALGKRIADQAVTLLANDGVLPLAPDARIVVVGPVADELRIHFGAYTSASDAEMLLGSRALAAGEIPGIDPKTFVFTDIFQARMPGIEPRFEANARGAHPDALTLLAALQAHSSTVAHLQAGSLLDDAEPLDDRSIVEAIAGADVVIAAVGERTGWVGNNTAGEGQTTAEPRLPGNQERLIRALTQTGVPVVTVVVTGRPLLLKEVVEQSAALVLAPLLGEHAGPAIADVLFGFVNPSGKLPSTFPRSVGQLPMYHGHHYGSGYDHPSGTRHGYNDLDDSAPLFAFGHGLSYTTFDISAESPAMENAGDLSIAVTVTNAGRTSGATVVQLYARVSAAPVVRPVRQLLDFVRLELVPGESRTIRLSSPVTRLAYTGIGGGRSVPDGTVVLSVGLASDDVRVESTTELGSRSEVET